MKISKPLIAKDQPLLWRQAISQSKLGKISAKNFFLYPLTKWFFSYKHYESALFDYLIIGSNPLLTQTILVNLYEQSLISQKTIRVGIYLTDSSDYWGYHLFEKEETWKYLQKISKNLGKSFTEFCQYKNIFSGGQLKITLINNDNNSISYYNKDNNYSNGYVFHLKAKEKIISDYQKSMPHVVRAENNIRLEYCKSYQKILEPFASHLYYSNNMNNTLDNPEKTHLLLAQNVFLTSLPTWLNCTTLQSEAVYHKTNFIHELNAFSFGTSFHTANDFLSMEQQTIEDLINLLQHFSI